LNEVIKLWTCSELKTASSL